jgi:hypothetical protein
MLLMQARSRLSSERLSVYVPSACTVRLDSGSKKRKYLFCLSVKHVELVKYFAHMPRRYLEAAARGNEEKGQVCDLQKGQVDQEPPDAVSCGSISSHCRDGENVDASEYAAAVNQP